MAKQLRIEKIEASTLVRIAWTGGGEVPDGLKGAYTNRALAEAAITRWLALNPEKDVSMVKPEKDDVGRGAKRGALPMDELK